jgi:cytochrome c oxidase subunit 2
MRTASAIAILGVLAIQACNLTEPTEPQAKAAARWSQCSPCHGDDGHGKLIQAAPPIASLPAWYVEAQLRNYRGQSPLRGFHFDDAPGLRMKPMAETLPEDMIKPMAEYVASLPPAGNVDATISGYAPNAAGTFALCVACHGADGSGNPALKAPPIAGQPDWYVYEQLRKYKSGVRGSNPNDVAGGQMRAIALGLGDDKALHDLARYVADLPVKRPH